MPPLKLPLLRELPKLELRELPLKLLELRDELLEYEPLRDERLTEGVEPTSELLRELDLLNELEREELW